MKVKNRRAGERRVEEATDQRERVSDRAAKEEEQHTHQRKEEGEQGRAGGGEEGHR
jgi:hypothetical protein